jgi:hypothetical protein
MAATLLASLSPVLAVFSPTLVASCGSSSTGAAPGAADASTTADATEGARADAATGPVDAASAAIDADATVEASDAETRVCDYTLANPACWQAFDIGGATSLQTGIFGGAFDGRYVYYANTQGTQVRVDTTVGFGASGSIATYNAGLGGPSWMRTPGFDGRYLYFPHLYGTTISRYDSLDGGFRSGSAWTTVVAPGPAGVDAAAVAAGYLGAIFDGRYMYFALQDSSGLVARYDTTADLDGSASWASFATSALSATSGSLRGGTFDGRYVYFAPDLSQPTDGGASAPTGAVTRLDTRATFTDAASWATFDLTGVQAAASGFSGAIFDGRYVYFVPASANGSVRPCVVARYDTTGDFAAAGSWAAFDTSPLNSDPSFYTWAFSGGTFDGRYVYFMPTGASQGVLLRFDTQDAFGDMASWETLTLSTVDSTASAFNGAVFDGEFVYLMPQGYEDALRFHARPPGGPTVDGGGSFF